MWVKTNKHTKHTGRRACEPCCTRNATCFSSPFLNQVYFSEGRSNPTSFSRPAHSSAGVMPACRFFISCSLSHSVSSHYLTSSLSFPEIRIAVHYDISQTLSSCLRFEASCFVVGWVARHYADSLLCFATLCRSVVPWSVHYS